MKRSTPFLVLFMLFVMAGCMTPRVLYVRRNICRNLGNLDRAIGAVRIANNAATTASASVEQARDRAGHALGEVKTLLNSVSEREIDPQVKAQVEELAKAYEDLNKTVEQLPENYAEVSLKAIVAEKAATVEAASSRVQSSLRCR